MTPRPSALSVSAVHCVKRARRHRWRWAQVTFCCAEEPVCHLWLQTLRELLEKLSMWREARSPGPARDPVIVAASLPFAHLPVTKCAAELGWLKNIPVLPVTGPAWHRALPRAWPSLTGREVAGGGGGGWAGTGPWAH